MKEQLNSIVNGWGVWLESVEITDVKISSRKLFEHMQIEFRENQRYNAEMVKLESNRTIRNEQLKKKGVNDKRQTDINRQKQMYDANERYKVQEEQHKVETQKKELEQKSILESYRLDRHKKQAQIEFNKYQRDLELKQQENKIANEKAIIAKQKELDEIDYQNRLINQ